WLVTIGFLAVIWLSAIGMSWWYVVFVCGSMTILYAWLMFGCWYEIDGEDLVIYQFFRPTRLPISKIKDVKKTSGYLATAGMSRLRVSISFTDRSVLKSYAPIEISPKDRDGFMSQLKSINPNIEITC
ncbi:PH domain-containing protein, partial [Muribaculum intestinale]